MKTKVIDLRPAFFVRGYNNVLDCVQALKPGIFQRYCNVLLLQSRRFAYKQKLYKAEKIIKYLNYLIDVFPDNPKNICNLSLLFNASFHDKLPLFISSVSVLQYLDINLIHHFFYFYYEITHNLNVCCTLHDMDKHDSFNQKDLFVLNRLHLINSVFNKYLVQIHLFRQDKFNQDEYFHKVSVQVNNYVSNSFPKEPFGKVLHGITYSLFNDKYAMEYPGLTIAQYLLFHSIFYTIHIKVDKHIIFLPFETNFVILLYLFDAYIHHWTGRTWYKPSNPCKQLVHQLNYINCEF